MLHVDGLTLVPYSGRAGTDAVRVCVQVRAVWGDAAGRGAARRRAARSGAVAAGGAVLGGRRGPQSR